ncbi:hypothetical protein JL722_2005 [Aureococcus anophagefferens]|nr:hypothetical protein JL722_2005 [Aureococcus anophagefferens]
MRLARRATLVDSWTRSESEAYRRTRGRVCDETPDNFTAPGYPTVAEEKLFRRRENRSCDAPTRHSLGKRRRAAEDDLAAAPRKASPPIVPTYAAPARDASSSDGGGGASSSDDDSAAASDDGGARGPPPRYADLSPRAASAAAPLRLGRRAAAAPYDSDDAPSDDAPSDDEPPRLPYGAPSDDERPPPAYGDGSSDDEPRRVGGAPPERQILLACPICLDVLEDAAALPCGHIFCDPCVSRDRQMRECPVCRASFRRRAVTPAATARAMVALLGEAGALDL